MEAGGTLTEFWSVETPRTTMIRISGYHRRRGWQAYWTAAIGRFTWKGQPNGIPSLEDLMGVERKKPKGQSRQEMIAAMSSWAAAAKRLH